MFNKFLRENKIASYILTVIRLYVGYEFLLAGFEKLSGGKFDASGFLAGAIHNPVLKFENLINSLAGTSGLLIDIFDCCNRKNNRVAINRPF